MASLLLTQCIHLCRTSYRASPIFRAQLSTFSRSQRPAAIAAAENLLESQYTNYTSGRWLYNEKKRLAERQVQFNMTALFEAAAASVNQRKSDIQSFRKLAEGGFNRVFEITMRDGVQVIARLPYSSTQPKSLATTSEVATMHLVRLHGVPTPRVYGYSADTKNPVRAEYILMEKVAGRLRLPDPVTG